LGRVDLPPNLRQFFHSEYCYPENEHPTKNKRTGEDAILKETMIPIVRHVNGFTMDNSEISSRISGPTIETSMVND
jgi:hypothetical protein